MNNRTAKTPKTAKNNRSHAFAVLEVFVVPRDATICVAAASSFSPKSAAISDIADHAAGGKNMPDADFRGWTGPDHDFACGAYFISRTSMAPFFTSRNGLPPLTPTVP